MKRELEQRLYQDFPKLYGGRTKPITQSLMAFGCECDDGWFNLIYTLSKDIQEYIDKGSCPQVDVLQVKEKFGTLRFYVGAADDHVFDLIDTAEFASGMVCEITGEPGEMYYSGCWIKTLCVAEAQRLNYTKESPDV